MVDASTLEPNYGDPYSSLAVQPVGGVQRNPAVTTTRVPVGGYDPAEFQADIARMTQIARQKSFDANGELSPELEHLGVNGPQYSQSGLGYFNAINDYLNSQKTGYNLTPQHINVYNPQTGAYEPLSDAQATAYGASPIANQFYANFNPAANGVKDWETGNIQFAPDQQYRIVDRATGKVLHEGVGYDAGNQITNYATDLTKSLGDQANWIIQKATPGTSDWTQAYEHIPYKSGLGTFLKVALPLALGPLGGLFGAAGGAGLGLGAVGTGALGAAVGSGLAGVANGDSIGDILKSAALSGGLSYAGGALGGALGGSGSTASTVASAAGDAGSGVGGLVGDLASDGITVVGSLGGAAGSAIGGGLGSLAGAAGSLATAPANGVTAPDGGDIIVNGIRTAAPAAAGSALGGLSGAALASALGNVAPLTPEQIAQGQQQVTDSNEIVVQGAKLQQAAAAINAGAGIGELTAMGLSPSQIDVARQLAEQQAANNQITVSHAPLSDPSSIIAPGGAALGLGGLSALGSGSTAAVGAEPITVTGTPQLTGTLDPVIAPGAVTAGGLGTALTSGGVIDPNEIVVQGASQTGVNAGSIVGGIGAAGAGAAAAGAGSTAAAPKTTLQKITDALTAAGLSSQLIGSLLGGGGGSLGNFSGALGNGNLSSVFHQTLPTSGTRIGGGSDLSARTMPQQDWTKYATRPSQSFFNYVPQTYTPPLPGQTDQWTHLAQGGPVEAPDYDYAGAEKAGVHPDARGHLPDTYKLPNHMTFSDDSVYNTPETPGGKWRQSSDGKWVFWPSEFNMQQHPMAVMRDYFNRVEPDSPAIYPSDFRLKKAAGGPINGDLAAKPRASFAVNGPGSGRSDHVPAMLSDGEYVMDAETVAMLGDGSNKAGADKLDQFRVNLRKHKGKQMAKGKFSLSAKAPEAYMAGVK